MCFIRKIFALTSLLTILVSCTEKLESGSLLVDFSGVDRIEVLSPTSVKIIWNLHDRYKEYEIYDSSKTEPLDVIQFGEYTVSNLSPDTSYTYKVVGKSGDSVVGGEREVTVTTWKRFAGVSKAVLGTENSVTVSWEYDKQVDSYLIFYKKQEDPTAANTSDWTVYNASTIANQYVFQNLDGSSRYHFVVQAKYKDGTYERSTKVVTANTTSSFPEPVVKLSRISIGSLPYVDVEPVVNLQYRNENYTTRVYKDGQAISDPLVGKGTLVFSSSANLPIGEAKNIEVRVNYKDSTVDETRVFDGLSTYIKGISPIKQSPPVLNSDLGVAFLGEAMTSGDFNCDGYEDLAVGMPNASITSLGNTVPQAGAVVIYYSELINGVYKLNRTGEPLISPARPGKDPQIITFDDLDRYSQFGYALAGKGNVNGDISGSNQCQDLLVGAPGFDSGGIEDQGAAFVFFGSEKGLKAPGHVKDMQQNIETCNGVLEGAICSAVMLWPNTALYPAGYYDPAQTVPSWARIRNNFGLSVAFVGDFNAGGYDDIAIGAPRGVWQGVANAALPGESKYVTNVGYVSMYFGSAYGVGYETPEASIAQSASDAKFRFLQIYPPIPTAGMKFGFSIAGGADVDGKFKVRRPDGTLVGGSDMIIGAPGFNYPDASDSANFKLPTGGSCPDNCKSVTPGDGGWFGGTSFTANGVNNAYGIKAGNGTDSGSISVTGGAPGAAFIYFGRGRDSAPAISDIDQPYRKTFWKCGRRGMLNLEHYSCLADASSFRILFPRGDLSGYVSRAFGSSVAILGDSSRYDSTNTTKTAFADANGDGWADIVVGTGFFSSPTKTNSGALWTFYGNAGRLYEYDSFYRLNGSNITNDWLDQMPNCAAFSDTTASTKMNCAPTLVRSESINSLAHLGAHSGAIAVGDISGDGQMDVVVGATGDTTVGTSAGAVYAFSSYKGYGLTSTFLKFYNDQSLTYSYFGRSVAIGNFDGDFATSGRPYLDVAAGAYLDRSHKLGGGAVYGFLSSGSVLSGVNQTPDFKIVDNLGSMQVFGYESASFVGDINGDGYDDVVAKISKASETGTGKITDAVVYYGSKLGLISTSYCLENIALIFKDAATDSSSCYPTVAPAQGITNDDIPLPQLIVRPSSLSASWALRAFAAGDVNGDGFADVAFVDPNATGQVTVFYGSASGLSAVNSPSWVAAIGDPQIITKIWGANSVEDADYAASFKHRAQYVYHGDFNGDGKSDLVLVDGHATSMFKMNVADGINPGPPPTGAAPAKGWQCLPVADEDCYSGRGSVHMGKLAIFYGSAQGVQTPKKASPSYTAGDEPSPNFVNPSSVSSWLIDTYGTETAATADKVCTGAPNNKCKVQYLYSPMVENVPYGYDTMRHQFGHSVAIMRNGDYDDLYVSAPGWEDVACYYDTNPKKSYGRIFIYRGGAQGIQAAERKSYYAPYAASTCTSDTAFQASDNTLNGNGGTGNGTAGTTRAIMPPLFGGLNSSDRLFGYRIANPGDINGDGYEDLVVTAPVQSPSSSLAKAGMGYVYYGPICGSDNTSAVWTYAFSNLNTQVEFSNPALGITPLIECNRSSNTPKPAPQAFYVKDAESGQQYGMTLMSSRTTGDFNDDGFDDVLLGSPYWDDPINAVDGYGRGVMFFGSSTGLHTSDIPDSVVVADSAGKVKPFIVRQTEVSIRPWYFYDLGSAGDVNGDGSMDLLVPTQQHSGYGTTKGVQTGTFFLLY
ncbi:fibronectin type III domain-containing protein [Bdellovibrio bacteriovorus]|uniref:Fibronectin type-III domain-containing protein n=1 Tax=Bdellovibrio bacteriovorus TaxID=959 RepID=A0A1Z3NC74_BDEBC|nr:fibronectin type III domain-containing protein [Bdellovibrio bacteriovorus]ASD65037.1 hypothetical protein B9G79_16410 [Bdellovibrio bacteriovorus]